MKFLFCSLSNHGLIYPSIGIAQVLSQRGHEVAFVTGSAFSKTLSQAGIERHFCTLENDLGFQIWNWGEESAIILQVKQIEYALNNFVPDVLVGQQLTLGPLIAAECHGLPVGILGLAAYLWPICESLLEHLPESEKERRLVWRYEETMENYNQVRKQIGLPQNHANYRETPLLGDAFLLQSVPELETDANMLPEKVHLIGSCLWEPFLFDVELVRWLTKFYASTDPLIYVQPGRSFQDPRFWPHLVDALGDCPVRVVASIGRMDGELGVIPKNFFVRNHIPQGFVLPKAQAVISSGHTTAVLGALTHGLPSLLFPYGSGTEDIAERCQQVGAAICLSPSEITAEKLRLAVDKLLNCSSLRYNAQTLQKAFANINGLQQAADSLESLAVNRRPVLRSLSELDSYVYSSNPK